ncbi:MAG: L-serine ammonia-lyase, iron-sulfur-dependent, subunit alpha [Bacteroidetes bacterium]|nr:L-serine ammonia-lyase, iron-sulfur-dependent, subunit alpha [Bacteroidota bacterium]
MESIRSIYKIGLGPSSSHTMGPRKAAELFRIENPACTHFRVTLYGSLAATGKGHLTDVAISGAFIPAITEFIWKPEEVLPIHTNGMKFETLDENGTIQNSKVDYSIGGGDLYSEKKPNTNQVYSISTMDEILAYVEKNGISFWEFVEKYEAPELWEYLVLVWKEMKTCLERGLETEGVLPGSIHLSRKAMQYHLRSNGFAGTLKRKTRLYSFALAVSEENAGGGKVVTAPTCGSSGVLPAVLYHMHVDYEMPESRIIKALAIAGLIGNLIKTNASISGATVGCQGEIGAACSMASAAATFLFGGTNGQIEYAAEIGMEHHLGLTCDPVCGLVQIPCIERNAFGAERALDACAYAILSDGHHHISFDKVVETMEQTGHDLPSLYKETSMGGLAIFGKEENNT